MKPFGATSLYARHRVAYIMREYRLCQQIATQPAPRFYVSEERAAIVVSAIIHHRRVPAMNPLKHAMYAEITRRARAEMRRHPSLSLTDTVARVVCQPAPSLYLLRSTVARIIHQHRQ